MQLTEIKDKVCPYCGAEPEVESKKQKHTNGHWNETRRFSCGLELSFSPNFMRTTESSYHGCPEDPKVKEKRKKIDAAKDKVMKFVEKLDAEVDFKMAIVDAIKWR